MRKYANYLQSRSAANWQFLPLVISAIILGSPFLFTGKVMFWGTVILQFIPWRHYAWTVLQSGHLPLWNPLVGMGAPLLANYQSALLYPPNWILFLLDSLGGISWLAWGQGFLVVFHWCLAGTGMIFLLKWLGVGKLGQAFGGVCFGLSSYLVGRASFLSINAAVAWMPWAVLFSSKLISDIFYKDKPSKRSFYILCIILALQLLAGHAQMTWYTILLVFIWSGFWGLRWVHGWVSFNRIKECFYTIIKFWFWITISIIIAGLISAAQLLPTFEYFLQSQRSTAVDLDLAMTYSFWGWRILTLFAPGMFGNPATGNYWGYGNYWEDALYVGFLPILLALWVLMRCWKKDNAAGVRREVSKRPVVIFLGIIIVISLALALGNNTPLFPWLYKHIPTFNMFQAPTRMSIWAIFSFAILAGFGIENLRRPTLKALYWSRLGTAGAFAIALGAGIVGVVFTDVAPTFIHAFTLMGFFGMICGAVVLTAPQNEAVEENNKTGLAILWKMVILVFVCSDLIISNWGLNPKIDPSIFNKIGSSAKSLDEKQRIYITKNTEYQLKFDYFMRFDTFFPSAGWDKLASIPLPNITTINNIPSANNFDPLLPATYSRWMDVLESKFENGHPDQYLKMLNLMAVGMVEELDLSTEAMIRYRQISDHQRVRLVNCAIPVKNNEQAMQLIRTNKIPADEEVIIEGLSADHEKICASAGAVNHDAEINITSEYSNHLSITIHSEIPGWLVLADLWYPGWTATINKINTPIYRANTLFRAVKVEGGDHIVEFNYRPDSFNVGLSLSLISLLLMAMFMVYPWKKTINP